MAILSRRTNTALGPGDAQGMLCIPGDAVVPSNPFSWPGKAGKARHRVVGIHAHITRGRFCRGLPQDSLRNNPPRARSSPRRGSAGRTWPMRGPALHTAGAGAHPAGPRGRLPGSGAGSQAARGRCPVDGARCPPSRGPGHRPACPGRLAPPLSRAPGDGAGVRSAERSGPAGGGRASRSPKLRPDSAPASAQGGARVPGGGGSRFPSLARGLNGPAPGKSLLF